MFTFMMLSALAAPSRELVTLEIQAECVRLAVVDAEGHPLELPEPVRQALACAGMVGLSPDGRWLVYTQDDDLALSDLRRAWSLGPLPSASEGISGLVWAPSGRRLAFVSVDQQQPGPAGHVVVIDLDRRGHATRSRTLSLKINFTCGGICAIAPADLGFVDEQTLRYRTWERVPYDLEGEAAERRAVIP